jgi:hypothetical protein
MVQLILKQVDSKRNNDMIQLWDRKGLLYCIVHCDAFHDGTLSHGEIYTSLMAGAEVTVNLTIAEEP